MPIAGRAGERRGIGRMCRSGRDLLQLLLSRVFAAVLLAVLLSGMALAQQAPLVLQRDGRTISLEPYAPNVVRVTMSINKAAATTAPGYGFVAAPSCLHRGRRLVWLVGSVIANGAIRIGKSA